MFNKTKKCSKSLGKLFTGSVVTALVVGNIVGASATAKINNDIYTATALSMGNKDLTKQLIGESFGNKIATQVSSVFSSVINGELTTIDDTIDELVDKYNKDYWESIVLNTSVTNSKINIVEVLNIFDNLYSDRKDIAIIANEPDMFEASNKLDKETMYNEFVKNYTEILNILTSTSEEVYSNADYNEAMNAFNNTFNETNRNTLTYN